MAQLNKDLEDYFKLNILLRRVGDTSQNTLRRFQNLLNTSFSNFSVEQQTSKELAQYLHPNPITNPIPLTPSRTLNFMLKDFNNDWPEFQCIYKCHFLIGVYDGEQNDKVKIKENIARLQKQALDERRKLVGLLIFNTPKETFYELDIERHYIFVPNVGTDSDIAGFLQPAMHKVVMECLTFLGDEVRKLKADENDYIVFNKNEERPEAKTLKKRKRGRCLKLAGDFCLMLEIEEEALLFYKEAVDLLRKNDDYHWIMGLEQGRAAAYFCRAHRIGRNEDPDKLVKNVEAQMNEAIEAAKKAKMYAFEGECYFRFFRALCRLKQPQMLDFYVSQFIEQSLKSNYVLDDQAIFLAEIALLYRQLGMKRKHNYFLALAAEIYLPTKPHVSKMFYSEIEKCSKIKHWKYLYALLLKTIIRADKAYQLGGRIHVELLDSCASKLTLPQINEIVQTLNFTDASAIQKKLNIVKLKKFRITESEIKPKQNRLVNYVREKGVTAPWKRLSLFKYQIGEPIQVFLALTNDLPIPIHVNYRILVSRVENQGKEPQSPAENHRYDSAYLEPNSNTNLRNTLVFSEKQYSPGNYKIVGLQIKLWNFIYALPIQKQIALEIYEPNANIEVAVSDIVAVEKSSLFSMQFQIVNKNQYRSSRAKLNISVYYTLETGLQENIYMFEEVEVLKSQRVRFRCRESSNKKAVFTIKSPNEVEVNFEQFKVSRSYLKKFEICLDYVKSQDSKYQISLVKTLQVEFRESVQCCISQILNPQQDMIDVVQRQSPSHSKIPTDRQVYIDTEFSTRVDFKKAPQDLKAYRIKVYKTATQQVIDELILSEQVQTQKIYSFPKQDKCEPGYLNGLLRVKWQCLTDQNIGGEFQPQTMHSLQDVRCIIEKNLYQVEVQYFIDRVKVDSGNLQIRRNQIITIQYAICARDQQSQKEFWHEIWLESVGIKQKRNSGCVIEGKTLMKSKKSSTSTRNSVEVEFECNYENSYVLVARIWQKNLDVAETYVGSRLIQCLQ